MKRLRDPDRGFKRILGMLAFAGAGVLAATQLRALMRYVNMRRMSVTRKHPLPEAPIGAASKAHTPRWGTTHWPSST